METRIRVRIIKKQSRYHRRRIFQGCLWIQTCDNVKIPEARRVLLAVLGGIENFIPCSLSDYPEAVDKTLLIVRDGHIVWETPPE